MTTQLSTSNIIAGCAVLILAFGSGAALVQSQFANTDRSITVNDTSSKERAVALHDEIAELKNSIADIHAELRHDLVSQNEFSQFQGRYNASLAHIDRLDAQIVKLNDNAAHEPVEKATLEAIINAADKRSDLFQSQIGDLNRQIAAALIVIDSSPNLARKIAPELPP